MSRGWAVPRLVSKLSEAPRQPNEVADPPAWPDALGGDKKPVAQSDCNGAPGARVTVLPCRGHREGAQLQTTDFIVDMDRMSSRAEVFVEDIADDMNKVWLQDGWASRCQCDLEWRVGEAGLCKAA